MRRHRGGDDMARPPHPAIFLRFAFQGYEGIFECESKLTWVRLHRVDCTNSVYDHGQRLLHTV